MKEENKPFPFTLNDIIEDTQPFFTERNYALNHALDVLIKEQVFKCVGVVCHIRDQVQIEKAPFL